MKNSSVYKRANISKQHFSKIINDPNAKGLIFGLTLQHTRAHLYRSALEGVGYSVGQILDVIREHGAAPDRIMAIGGGAQNRPWMQIVADIIGLPLYINEITVGASYGDALMAAIGSGQLGGREIIHPDPRTHELYRPYQEMFRALYLNNRELMHQDGKSSA